MHIVLLSSLLLYSVCVKSSLAADQPNASSRKRTNSALSATHDNSNRNIQIVSCMKEESICRQVYEEMEKQENYLLKNASLDYFPDATDAVNKYIEGNRELLEQVRLKKIANAMALRLKDGCAINNNDMAWQIAHDLEGLDKVNRETLKKCTKNAPQPSQEPLSKKQKHS